MKIKLIPSARARACDGSGDVALRGMAKTLVKELTCFQVVTRSDKILPYYVLDVAANVPGLPGLFLAGLVSAGLSTMSAGLNTATGTIYEDFIDPWMPESNDKEAKAANIMKVQRRPRAEYITVRNREENKGFSSFLCFLVSLVVQYCYNYK